MPMKPAISPVDGSPNSKKPARASRPGAAAVNLGELTESTGYCLLRAELIAYGNLSATLKPLELSPVQFSVLVLIAANPDLAQSDLCSALGVHKGNFVPMLDHLEKRGLTERLASRVDRRIKTLALTAEGNRLFKRAVKLHAMHERRLLTVLGKPGRDQLTSLLNRIIDLKRG